MKQRKRSTVIDVALILIPAFLMLTAAVPAAWAHGVVGKRMFIEPITTEDANVKNELDLPNGDFLPQPDGTQRTLGFSFEKSLYPKKVSVVIEGARIFRKNPTTSGWDNLDVGLKWEAYENKKHELAFTPALFTTLPTGTTAVVTHETALKPMLLLAKGFGDVPATWFRPFAVQADAGYRATVHGPDSKEAVYDAVLMYSMPYLNRWIRHADGGYNLENNLRRGLSAGALWGNMFPFVEFNGTSAMQGTPGGTSALLRPGLVWMGKYFQLSVAADINLEAAGNQRRYGAAVLVDWFLDDMIPAIGRTPFGPASGH